MARQTLTAQAPLIGGVVKTWATPTVDGFKFSADNLEYLEIQNGNAGTCNVTLGVPHTVAGVAHTGRVIAVAAGAEKLIALDPTLYRRANDNSTDPGLMWADFSVFTSVKVALISPSRG